MKKNVIIILSVIIVCLVSYIIYDKVISKGLNSNRYNTISETTKNGMSTVINSSDKKENITNTTSILNSTISNTSNNVENAKLNTTIITNESNSTTIEKDNGESLVKDLYIENIKKRETLTKDNLLDYRIDSIEIITGTKKDNLLNSEAFNGASNDAIFAIVEYSVKPKDVNNTSWIAANGGIEGDWITNKCACIVIEKQNGKYTITSEGTSF